MSDFDKPLVGPPTFPPPFPRQGPYRFQQPIVYYHGAPARTCGLAVASMVLGILWLWWLGSILAVILGHVAISQVHRDPKMQGKGMAIAGLILGYIGLATLVLTLVAITVAARV